MIHFDDKSLRELGIHSLTGERCGISMRMLCDISVEAQELLRCFFSVHEIKFEEGWNHDRPWASIMLSRETLREVWRFHMQMNKCIVVLYKNGSMDAVDAVDIADGWGEILDSREQRAIYNVQCSYGSYTPQEGISRADGLNVHQMSGR